MKEFPPFKVPDLTKAEVVAIQMCSNPQENAEPAQQALAIKAIVEKICIVDVQPIQFGSPDETGFLNGRVFCGKEILRTNRRNVGDMSE